jgi:hypothetical protein
MSPLVIYGGLLAYVVIGLLPDGEPYDLAFPMEGGHFVVAQGGGNVLLNHHSGHPAQHHAADITAVDRLGFRARGLLPHDPKRYVIFGADVVSPCDGTVTHAMDRLPDHDPPRSDPDNPAGNHIIIACDGIEIVLAHLRQGSVAVEAQDSVTEGQRIAEVGNTGNSTEPHLHIHAVDLETEIGVQIAFDGDLPLRNRTFQR